MFGNTSSLGFKVKSPSDHHAGRNPHTDASVEDVKAAIMDSLATF